MVLVRSEDKLLVCCARLCEESYRADQIRALLEKNLDWSYLLRSALEHGMMPLLHWQLDAMCPQAVPKVPSSRLRTYFQENALRNLSLTKELIEILEVFEAHGIPALPYKGPTLTALAYGNLALRQFLDLDILVHREDIHRAKESLASKGYQQRGPVAGAQELALIHSGAEHVLDRNDGTKTMVELHWSIAKRHYSFSLDAKDLWRHLEPVSLGGAVVWTLPPEDLLLVLCWHGGKHLWNRLIWICDIAKLIDAHEGMEWNRLVERASMLGSERMLLLGLFLANDLLGAALPDEILHKVRADPMVGTLATQVLEGLFGEPNGRQSVFDDVRLQPFHLRMRERMRDKLRYSVLAVVVPNKEDLMSIQLPTPLWPLYYLLRPARLLGKYGGRLLGRRL